MIKKIYKNTDLDPKNLIYNRALYNFSKLSFFEVIQCFERQFKQHLA
jgi:hypothetical protein